MERVFILLAVAISITAKAQVTKVSLQASGLTCSMCSNAINKALKTLDFVDKVEADLHNYTYEISFKPDISVDFNKIKRKVEDAGFSVSSFVATIYFDKVLIKPNQPLRIGGQTFLISGSPEQTLNGAKQVKVLDKGFVSPRDDKNKIVGLPSSNEMLYHVSL